MNRMQSEQSEALPKSLPWILSAEAALEACMRRNLDLRGMACIHSDPHALFLSAMALKGATRVLILTGFFIKSAGVGETDGPMGAVVLAKALLAMGKEISVLTDCYSEPLIRALSKLEGLDLKIECVSVGVSREALEQMLNQISPSHIISIERPGTASDGRLYSMSGEDLTDYIPSLDPFFEGAKQRGIITIAVGDGGNELGMGSVAKVVGEQVPYGDRIAAQSVADYLLVSGISNWGAYALVAMLSVLDERITTHSVASDQAMLKALYDVGAVDGATKQRGKTIDGMAYMMTEEVITAIQEIGLKYSVYR